MELGGEKMYSPKCALAELKNADDMKIIDAFRDRTRSWYFKPIEMMLKEPQNDFISLAIECMLIDALSGYYFGLQNDTRGGHFKKFIREVLPGIKDETVAHEFYDAFRNGILHETRVKRTGFISRDIEDEVVEYKGGLIVNPQRLHRVLENWFDSYMKTLSKDEDCRRKFRDRFVDLYEDHDELKEGTLIGRHIPS